MEKIINMKVAYNLDPKEYFKKKNTVAACDILVKQILKDFPNSADNLCDLLLDFKYKLEEGIGQKK